VHVVPAFTFETNDLTTKTEDGFLLDHGIFNYAGLHPVTAPTVKSMAPQGKTAPPAARAQKGPTAPPHVAEAKDEDASSMSLENLQTTAKPPARGGPAPHKAEALERRQVVAPPGVLDAKSESASPSGAETLAASMAAAPKRPTAAPPRRPDSTILMSDQDRSMRENFGPGPLPVASSYGAFSQHLREQRLHGEEMDRRLEEAKKEVFEGDFEDDKVRLCVSNSTVTVS
jgi:hypothetical protein